MAENKPKKPVLEEITELEYIELLENNLFVCKTQYEKMLFSYNSYSIDRNRYKLKYYVQDGKMFYKRFIKDEIGFKKK